MKLLKLIVLSLLLSSLAFAQNPFAFLDQLVSTEEHLIHMEQVGDYIVNADGQRLLHDPYLRFDIKHNGQPISADSDVRIESTLFLPDERVDKTYIPEHDGERFVVKPLDLEKAKSMSWDQGGWLRMNIVINGPAGKAEETVGIQIYPPKLEGGLMFRAINVAIPFLVLGIFVVIYRFANVRIRRLPAQST